MSRDLPREVECPLRASSGRSPAALMRTFSGTANVVAGVAASDP